MRPAPPGDSSSLNRGAPPSPHHRCMSDRSEAATVIRTRSKCRRRCGHRTAAARSQRHRLQGHGLLLGWHPAVGCCCVGCCRRLPGDGRRRGGVAGGDGRGDGGQATTSSGDGRQGDGRWWRGHRRGRQRRRWRRGHHRRVVGGVGGVVTGVVGGAVGGVVADVVTSVVRCSGDGAAFQAAAGTE